MVIQFAGIFPGRGRVTWRDWFTHDVVNASIGTNTTLDAPLGTINVHIRDGSAILLHSQPAYTIEETRQGPYSLLVSQAADGYAFGTAYIDDGETVPPTPNSTLTFKSQKGGLSITHHGTFKVTQNLDAITILGALKPASVSLNGADVEFQYVDAQQKLTLSSLSVDLNEPVTLLWK